MQAAVSTGKVAKASKVKKSSLKLKFLKAAPKAAKALEAAAKAPAAAKAAGADTGAIEVGAKVVVCSDRHASTCGREGTITQLVQGVATLRSTGRMEVMQAPCPQISRT